MATMEQVNRTDYASLGPPEVLPSGFVRYDAYIARAGCLQYPWGVEYRPSEENVRALASIEGAPVTFHHPPEEEVTVHTPRERIVGCTIKPRMDGEHIRATILVTDPAAIAAIKRGDARQISMGYRADSDPTPGVSPTGETYSAVQKNIVVNHIAIVPLGRAGPTVALRADKKDAHTMMIRIDGKDVEMTDQVAGYVKGLAARADALEAELKALPAIIRAEEQRRSDAVAVATKVGSQTTGTLAEIQAAVATKVLGVELRADSSAEYVAGCYAAALKISARDEKKVDHVDSAVDPLEAARAQYLNSIHGSK